jgi:hypothetical protein
MRFSLNDCLLLNEVHNMRETGDANILKGMLAGAMGGLVASWTMNEFQKAWTAAEKRITGGRQGQDGGQQNGEDAEDAT